MISKINYSTNMPVSMRQAPVIKEDAKVKAQQSYVSVPNKDFGMEALGKYGMSLVNFTNKLDIRPVLPTIYKNIEDIEGERIYSSDGKLNSIVKETPTHKTTYFVPKDNQNKVDYIETIDKKTNKAVYTQHNRFDENGNFEEMYVTTHDARTGKEKEFSCYEDGKLAYAGKITEGRKGEMVEITKYFNGDRSYYISEANEKTNNYKYITISDDKKIIDFREERSTPKGTIESTVRFYEGLPFAVEKNHRSSIPNLIGIGIMMDNDLKPAPKIDFKAIEMDIRNAAGEETRYSNGALESKKVVVRGKELEAFFNPNNELVKVNIGNIELEADGEKIIRVKQDFGEGKSKETFLNENITRVVYKDNDITKEYGFDTKTKKPEYYNETAEADGEEKGKKSIYFDNFGVANAIYTW